MSRALPALADVQGLDIFEPVEAAVFLRLPVRTPLAASRGIRRLRIRKVVLGHRTVRYLRKDLMDYMEGHAA